MQPPGTHAYRLHFVGGHFRARAPQGLRDDISCGFVCRLAMHNAGGLLGPGGEAEYEYDSTTRSQHGFRIRDN